MKLLYDIAVFFYHFFIRVMAPFHPKARLFVRGRRGWQGKLKEKRDPDSSWIWFHCASLGEFEQGRPVIEAIGRARPGYKIAITFFSPSGYEIRKNYSQAAFVGYLPEDTPRNAAMFLDTLQPAIAFFVKYEFWYHYIDGLKNRNIPLFLVSGIFRKEQLFFSRMPWGGWFRDLLKAFPRHFVQDENSAALLNSIGIDDVTISGDTRFDRVASIAESSQPVPVVEKFCEGKPVLIAGSTWKPDEELLVPFINSREGWKFILVPHEVSPGNINRLVHMLKNPPLLMSRAAETDLTRYQVLIIDSVGLLSSLYKYGTYAYIGGGFGVGIHNILEAATFGLPVFFGPNYHKFREAVQLIGLGAAFTVSDTESFTEQLLKLLNNRELYEQASLSASAYVKNNRGATETILKTVFSFQA